MPMELRLVVLMHLPYLGSYKKKFIKPWAKRMAENTRLAGVCVGAGAVRRDSVWVVSYWYVRTSRATGLSSSSAEPLGSRLSAVI